MTAPKPEHERGDRAPGNDHDASNWVRDLRNYLIGFGLAIILTVASFVTAETGLIWGPAIPAALVALAIAQMGVHLIFFLHISTGPDNVNNVLALAFGILIVALVVGGSLWIMSNLNHNMMPMHEIMQMQR